jgi:TonB-linked SusC/RagA family outer membrane protein
LFNPPRPKVEAATPLKSSGRGQNCYKSMQKATLCNWAALRRHRYINQVLLIMRLTTILLTAAFLNVSAKGISQNITFSGNNVSLEEVFQVLKKQTGYVFFYNATVLEDTKPISINAENVPFDEFMNDVFQGQPVKYLIEDKTVIITRKPRTSDVKSAGNSSPPSDIIINVTNAQREYLSGVNIIIKRTGRGVTTNAKGNAVLKNANGDDILIVSMVGYKTQAIPVANKSDFAIVMQVDVDGLDKVVIQGYGKTSDRLRTGNIATVTAQEIERQPIMNPILALQGKVPGLIVQQTTGYASSPVKIELRGRSVIDGSNPVEPLYVIDGVPLKILELSGGNYDAGSSGFLQNGSGGPAGGQSPFFSINPNDIESMSVLKDADATAIYGSRGANGVILITTKKGKPGRTKFESSVYRGIQKVTRFYKMLNTKQYLQTRREAFTNDGMMPDDGLAYDLLIWDTTKYTDWQKYLWGGVGSVTDVQLGLSGGDNRTTFRVAGGYHTERSISTYSGSDRRGSIQFNLSHKSINERLTMSFISTYSYAESSLISLSGLVTLPPNAPAVFDANGNLNYSGWAPISYMFPFSNILTPYTAKTGFLNSQLSVKYSIAKGLNFLTDIGYSTNRTSQVSLYPIAAQDPARNPTGSANFGNNNGTRWNVEPQLEYSTRLAKAKFNLLVGGTAQKISQDGNNIQGSGYVNDNLLHSISNAPSKSASDNWGQYRYSAVFGRLNFNWNDTYILNLSGRRDGSSRFGPGKQFGNFGAIGGALIFTEFKWFKTHIPFLSFGKLRTSYGTTGSDIIGDYAYLSRWTGAGISPYSTLPAYVPMQHANPDLQWQSNKTLESALQLGLLNDRLTMELSWYRSRCGNQLVLYPLPTLTGFNSVYTNFQATVQNKGVEGNFKYKIVETKKLVWSAGFNIGLNKNKLLAFPDLLQSPYAYTIFVGQPLNLLGILHYTGIDAATGKYTFEDKNKDGRISMQYGPEGDRFYKDMNVKFDGGFSTDFMFNGFEINFFFHFRKREARKAIYSSTVPGSTANQSVQVLDRWKQPGDVAQFARYSNWGDESDNNFTLSDGIYDDASFLRLRNISVSYDFPGKWISKVQMHSLKAYLRGENVFVLSGYNGLDPEVPAFGVLPISKVLTVGLQINF